MKSQRQKLILRIIQEQPVGTQEQLTRLLMEKGINVTQATVSRDIKELQLIKLPDDSGIYRYTLPEEGTSAADRERLFRVLRESVLSIDVSENIVVVKTVTAAAAAAAEAIDRMEWPEVIGTVAGDNTLLVVAKPKEAADIVLDRLRQVLDTGSV